MKCLILAAGYATRLYPLTENFPKPLLKVGDRTILDWLIDDIHSSGLVDEFVVISNHKFAAIFEKWAQGRQPQPTKTSASLHPSQPDGWAPPVHSATGGQGFLRAEAALPWPVIKVVDDGTSTNETRLGAVCDIKFAIDKLGLDDDMLVIAGDNVLDFSLVKFVEYATRKGTSCIMRYFEADEKRLHKSGIVEVDDNDLILSMEEKPSQPKSNWCCPPFYYYTKEDARLVGEGIASGCGTDAPGSYIAWLATRVPVHAMEMPGKRYDIGNLESYHQVCQEYSGII